MFSTILWWFVCLLENWFVLCFCSLLHIFQQSFRIGYWSFIVILLKISSLQVILTNFYSFYFIIGLKKCLLLSLYLKIFHAKSNRSVKFLLDIGIQQKCIREWCIWISRIEMNANQYTNLSNGLTNCDGFGTLKFGFKGSCSEWRALKQII